MPLKRVRAVYRGEVQGVGFRYTSRRVAGRFAVSGWVHWQRVQHAMESHTRLPRQPMAAILAFGVAALALALVVSILLTGS